MTALGATIYGGFFVLAALWLGLTRESADAEIDDYNDTAAPKRARVLAGRGSLR